MKVIAINGSPRQNGNTAYALRTIGQVLTSENIQFDTIEVGSSPVRGCLACGSCQRSADGRCAITTDLVNDTLARLRDADGIIIGSPVYYSGIAGTMKCFLDRTFYTAAANGGLFRHKIGAAIVAVRRSGGSSTLDALHHYLTLSEMLIPTSNYWPIIHGRLPQEASLDAEGQQTMQVLAQNITWMLRLRAQGLPQAPEKVQKVMTNFIR
jgi:multimeric flavodoxin WrbA